MKGRKTPKQCRGHHNEQIRVHKSVDKIIEGLKGQALHSNKKKG